MDIIFFCRNCGLCINEITTYHVPKLEFKFVYCPQCGVEAAWFDKSHEVNNRKDVINASDMGN